MNCSSVVDAANLVEHPLIFRQNVFNRNKICLGHLSLAFRWSRDDWAGSKFAIFYVEPDGPSVVFRTHMYIHSWFISFISFKWQGARTFDVQYPRTLKWTLKFRTWNLPQYPSPSASRFCCRARLARDRSRRKPCIVHNTLPIERRAILIVTKYFQFSFF